MYPSANAATPYIFPRPLNATFTAAFWNSPSRRNSTNNETDNLLRSAAYDLPRPLWGIGSDFSELHAGDLVYAKWKGDNVINLAWYCLMCTLGVETGDVWSACENYTKSVSTFISTASSHGPLSGPMIAPSFAKWNTPIPPKEICGLCFLTQFEDHLAWANTGYTIPFPVFAAYHPLTYRSEKFDNFSTEHPAGTLILSFPTATSFPRLPDIVTTGRGGKGSYSHKAAVIAGSFFGVGVLLILLWRYWRWTKAKNLARGSTSTNNLEMHRTRPMMRGGFERTPDSMVSEPPPAYHEIVRDRGREA